MTQMLMKNNY